MRLCQESACFVRGPRRRERARDTSSMKIIGLTGGIASGKSSVSRLLSAEHGIPIVDLDIIARQALAPGTFAFCKVVAIFGQAILSGGRRLERRGAAGEQCRVQPLGARHAPRLLQHGSAGSNAALSRALAAGIRNWTL